MYTVKPVLSGHSKRRPKIGSRVSLNAGQKYCRMLQGEHSAILLTFIKVPFVINILVFSIFEWPLKTGFNDNVYTKEKMDPPHVFFNCMIRTILTILKMNQSVFKLDQ